MVWTPEVSQARHAGARGAPALLDWAGLTVLISSEVSGLHSLLVLGFGSCEASTWSPHCSSYFFSRATLQNHPPNTPTAPLLSTFGHPSFSDQLWEKGCGGHYLSCWPMAVPEFLTC